MEKINNTLDEGCTEQTTYHLSTNDGYQFHTDNLRDNQIEIDNIPHHFAVAFIRIKPFIDKCMQDSYLNGPGLCLFKFLKDSKRKKLIEKGLCAANTNCEYHYISQTSFYHKKIIDAVINKDVINKYTWNTNLLVIIQLHNKGESSRLHEDSNNISYCDNKYELHANII